MTNGDDGSALTDEILMALAAEYDWPGYGQRQRAATALDPKSLEKLVGEYAAPNPGAKDRAPIPVLVTGEGGRLFLEARPFVPKLEIFAASTDSFFTLSGGTVVFSRDASGRGVAVSLGAQTATRLK